MGSGTPRSLAGVPDGSQDQPGGEELGPIDAASALADAYGSVMLAVSLPVARRTPEPEP
ncbi:MAG: hypothetical protein ABIQ53_04905 [Terracoccus sp.]